MTSIAFTISPYLLFVAIPLIGLSLIPYFKISKKYRRTRNRIISLVLHCVTIVLATLALSGIQFVHKISNTANELILLVDMSDTQNESAKNRNGFISDVLKESVYQNFTVGVVTFGIDQVYAVPLTTDAGSVYGAFLQAELPDTSATDIEAAIQYASTLFNHPESGKIVLVTDGKETDGNAVSSSAISALAAQGTKLDTVYVASDYEGNEFQILSVETPDVQIKAGKEITIGINVFSRDDGMVRLNAYDNGEQVEIGKEGAGTTDYKVRLAKGSQTITIPFTFGKEGIHEIKFELVEESTGAQDRIDKNNFYFTYVNLEVFKKVLIVENFSDESLALKDVLKDSKMLDESELYDVSIFNLQQDRLLHYEGDEPEEGDVPQSVDDFRKYDQVILNNVANADLVNRAIPLDKMLYSYVYEFGGGMLTVGGSDPTTVSPDKPYGDAHAYNRSDMYGSVYQEMLPVEAVNYTPPVGLYLIVDVSGSMTGMSDPIAGETRLHWACRGAEACVDALTERDQIGIITLESNYSDVLPLTPRTDRRKIDAAIASLAEMGGGGTKFLPSLEFAVSQLRAAQMEKNHIIFISDGEVDAKDMEDCAKLGAECYEDEKLNLTISMVCIGGSAKESTRQLVSATRPENWFDEHPEGSAGSGYYTFDSSNVESEIALKLIQDLSVSEIFEINYQPFKPIVFNKLSQVVQGIVLDGNYVDVELGGYYGVKKRNRDSVDLVLTGSSQVPIYARWKFGNGSVGCFMCDLKGGDWSKSFMESENGKQLVYNMINELMPKTNIRPQEIRVNLSSKNYSNHLTCPTALQEGEIIRGTIHTPDGETVSLNEAGGVEGCTVTRALNDTNKYSVCEFLITKGGIYKIVLEKLDAQENVLSTTTLYKEFSYSKEYDVEYESSELEIRGFLQSLAAKGKGTQFDGSDESLDVSLIFQGYETELKRVYDPRLILIIVAAILFLIDVAVRKFKFKWIHEIVRERKAKRESEQFRKEGGNEKNH